MKKNEKGVTLIQTVIAVMMIILIASFTILNSRDTVTETKIAKVYNEIITVKRAVMDIEILEDEGMNIFNAERIYNFDEFPALASRYKEDQEYYYLEFETNGKELQEKLDIKNVENNYIVNVKNIENIEIFLEKGIEVKDNILYTDEDIIEEYNNIFLIK